MQTFTQRLIPEHEQELHTLPYAMHIRCDILVPICQGVDYVVKPVPLIVERTVPVFCIICNWRDLVDSHVLVLRIVDIWRKKDEEKVPSQVLS